MSRATINTGGIDFNLSEQTTSNNTRSNSMHMAILGDFSGRKNRGEESPDSLNNRKLIEINRDNFDTVFANLAPSLRLPISDKPLYFSELDDLHPDFIYQNITLFDQLRSLKRKLKNKNSFSQAAEEIQAWSNYREQTDSSEQQSNQTSPQSIAMPHSLLEAALQGHDIAEKINQGPLGNIDKLIKDIVSPFTQTQADTKQKELLAAVDSASSETMRTIMHHSDFQQLEAAWRGLYWLIRQIDSNSGLSIYLMDISQQELRADLEKNAADSYVYQHLVESRRSVGSTPFSVIVGDYQLYKNAEDVELASQMAALAADSNACWISAGHEQLAGCEQLSAEIDPDNWDVTTDHRSNKNADESWLQMRQLPTAKHLALAAPRFLLRLPYGNKTLSTESFAYEELVEKNSHRFYLWGNSAFLLASLLAKAYNQQGWAAQPGQYNTVENLPLHVYYHEGESLIKPCAELLITDRTAKALSQAGLLVLRSVQNSDTIQIPSFQSVALNQERIKGAW